MPADYSFGPLQYGGLHFQDSTPYVQVLDVPDCWQRLPAVQLVASAA